MPDWQFTDNYSNNDPGRIWIGWNPVEVSVSTLYASDQVIFVQIVTSRGFQFAVGFGYVDGSLTPNNYLDFWNCTQDSFLFDLAYSGCFYTWTNGHTDERKILSKLDRAIVNMEWVTRFSDSKVVFLEDGISDHSPMVVSIFEDRVHGPPPFIFYNFMIEEPDFLEMIRTIWKEPWKRERFRSIPAQVEHAKSVLYTIQQHIQQHPLYVESAQQENVAIKHYAKVTRYEEYVAKQKSRVKWIDLGDSNAIFFHNCMKERHSRNNILTLMSRENVFHQEDKEIAEECIDFYSSLFDDSDSYFVDDSELLDFLNFDNLLSDERRCNLIRPVIRDEVVVALSTIGSNKAPGPDDFSSWFFKTCWSILGDDFTADVQNFFKHSKLLKERNVFFYPSDNVRRII
ncbi:uncharacterized protein LOC113352411 [Papaver somniferum]|uniref:uncharacterized protein LOC113352411 n=1 Tax=Papaver somniferum TaxID=3469 RepID=UPI000E6FF638|nr:uncharacterized protein LOC113352411 [Papaver somniferum]